MITQKQFAYNYRFLVSAIRTTFFLVLAQMAELFSRTWLRYVRVFAIANPPVVCSVRAPYSGVETFGDISSLFCTFAMVWPPCKILRRSS